MTKFSAMVRLILGGESGSGISPAFHPADLLFHRRRKGDDISDGDDDVVLGQRPAIIEGIDHGPIDRLLNLSAVKPFRHLDQHI